jgi:mRNA interferase YafQ
MLTPAYTSQFKKDFKLVKKRNKDLDKLETVVEMIVNEIPLPQKYKEHELKGIYKDCLECHITPDWLLIYIVDTENSIVTFVRTGSHSDLF